MNKKNILLCVAGATPQIITETLYDLVITQKQAVNEIIVITTLEGRNKILKALLDEKDGKFFEFCRDFGIAENAIKFDETCIYLLHSKDGKMLEDIRTPEENELAGDQICEIVREICKNKDAKIFASAAGGRKTMSIYLTLAMSLFGRAEDSLSHVLVNSDFEMNPQFFYPTPTPKLIKLRDGREVSTETAEIYLAPIPFIRLQGTQNWLKLPDGKRYGELVKEAQSYLDKDERKLPLNINLQTKEISVDDVTGKVTDFQLLLYVLFAEKKFTNQGENGFVQLNSLCREDFEKAFEKIMTARGKSLKIGGSLHRTDWEFLLNLVEQAESHNEIDYEDFMNALSRAIGRLNKKLKTIPDKYKISSIGAKRPKKYGLQITKELINIF